MQVGDDSAYLEDRQQWSKYSAVYGIKRCRWESVDFLQISLQNADVVSLLLGWIDMYTSS